MTVTSDSERTYGRGSSLPGRRSHRDAHGREELSRRGRRTALARSTAPPAAHKNQDHKRPEFPARSEPPAGPRREAPKPEPGSGKSRVEKSEELPRNNVDERSPPMLRPCSSGASLFRMHPVTVETQMHPIAMETEYRCSFQGLSPPRGPRLRKHLERRQRVPLFHTRTVHAHARCCCCCFGRFCHCCLMTILFDQSLKMREESDDMPHPQHDGPTHQKKATPPPQVHRRHRKLTEYEAGFPRPPCGAAGETPQVALLRQKASWYRRRAWGTNFSRQHLSQLTSQHNFLWEPSTDAPSPRPTSDPRLTPDLRRPPYVEALDLASCSTSSSGPASPARGGPVAPPTCCKTIWATEGQEDGVERSPTPEMVSRPLHRTHLDVTTPATAGGAILVGRSSSEEAFQVTDWMNSLDNRQTDRLTVCSIPALLHRPSSAAKCRPILSGLSPAPPPMHVIRGRLRHAEFQHNGELGLRFHSHQGFGSNFHPDEGDSPSPLLLPELPFECTLSPWKRFGTQPSLGLWVPVPNAVPSFWPRRASAGDVEPLGGGVFGGGGRAGARADEGSGVLGEELNPRPLNQPTNQ
ncbi:nuclear protein MDM1 isoform X2 [Phyllopteryx taeniolatus]|uniref:nuclear protein MDM1 isoform X2 n=1 Tax=Phyllopteryx taeniolatus TaxID=161469 RepID=UPI002AD48692|nr:nuclear protein MDM1 isoform X2 [Phyllopteryx taeniolatus]